VDFKTRNIPALNRETSVFVGLLILLAATFVFAADTHGASNKRTAVQYTLEFVPTRNALPGTSATMTITVVDGQTTVTFDLNKGYPDTVYTVWIVYNKLTWPLQYNSSGFPLADPATNDQTFPPEGLGVAPAGRLDQPFTDGMGLDQGITLVTNGGGNGYAQITLDYDLVAEAPVANKNIVTQCVPSVSNCIKKLSIASTWLRKYVIEFPVFQRAANCANYDPAYDPDVSGRDPNSGLYDPVATVLDSRFWQCIDLATLRNPNDPWSGLPRVPRFKFDHFRLAPHPDFATHGLFGGNVTEHFIDMIGRRCDLRPIPAGESC
jgi:hypothetical protein